MRRVTEPSLSLFFSKWSCVSDQGRWSGIFGAFCLYLSSSVISIKYYNKKAFTGV